MKKSRVTRLRISLLMSAAAVFVLPGESRWSSITTNKDKLLSLAVQGQIASAQPSSTYAVTWDGKPKMTIGTGGINYNLKIGGRIFGWASGDRATVGVAAEGTGDERSATAWLTYPSIGNEARLLSGQAKGEKGVIVGKFGSYVLIHFERDVLEKLAIDDPLLVKACGIGLEIDGFKDVFVHGLAPDLLERLDIRAAGGKLEVPVVKEIPSEIIGQGAGASALSGNWHIQTCFPPDIEKYGLDELRFGDLVFLKDIQTDYGKGYYRGGATVGVVCSGPSDIAGLGIGVTPVLSTRFGKLAARIDPSANVGKFLGLRMEPKETSPRRDSRPSGTLKTNRDELIVTAVQGIVQPPGSRGFSTTTDGRSVQDIGMASINYSVSVGDPAYGWAGDHVEPDITIQGRDRPRPIECALALLACIGNEADVVSGEAKGGKGIYIGRHGGSNDLVWFPKPVVERLALNDKIQVKARGVGLKIRGFEDVWLNKLAPELAENMGLAAERGQLVVPVVMEVPGHLMGSGMGTPFVYALDYDIQTTCPEVVEEYGFKRLRIGDLVAIRDHYNAYGTGRYPGAVTIGVVIHGFSDWAGHGPGLNPVLSALPGRIRARIDPKANVASYLRIKTI